ncbi:MAG: TetR/AcrR family transcriptional regulator [Rhizobiaceae bacterium]|nr:TetR/AcrR family transcriptional regulator [Rhizobiaceae bacterium]
MSSVKLDTKSRIFEATWKLMEDHHGQGVRMSDIAKAAGISRQALYLHFDDRSNLLIATTQYMDEKSGIEEQLQPSRDAPDGKTRLREYIKVMGNHFPNIQGVARALLAIKDTDEAARAAWDERMGAIREGCEAAITMLEAEGNLVKGLSRKVATDLLWVLLSFQNWDQLTNHCDWSSEEYISHIQKQAERSFVAR